MYFLMYGLVEVWTFDAQGILPIATHAQYNFLPIGVTATQLPVAAYYI